MGHLCIANEVDVIVVGSGIAGLAAAIESAACGCEVIVLEKRKVIGGNSRISAGEFAAYTDPLRLAQKLGLGDDSAESHREDMLRAGGYQGDPELVDKVAREAPGALEWLMSLGVLFEEVLTKPGGHSSYRCHAIKGGGVALVRALNKAARRTGVKVLLEHEAKSLIAESGRIQGVRVTTRHGVREFCAKKGVVLATGGFAADTAMVRRYDPSLPPLIKSTNHRRATGEGIGMALAVGADTVHLNFVQLNPFANPWTGKLDRPSVIPFKAPAWGLIYVDQEGKRFVNELATRGTLSRAQIALREGPTFGIANKKILLRAGFSWKEIEKWMSRGRIIAAGTLADLANRLGVDAQSLTDTIRLHNDFVRQREDRQFGKPIDGHMMSIDEPPYCAIAQWPAVHYCMGGLRININAQVLDMNREVIQGLYACGEVAGGIHGMDRLGGCALPECVIFGRTAGQKVACPH